MNLDGSWPLVGRLLGWILLSGWLPKPALAIICNYCYNADSIADCLLTSRKCESTQVCFVDTSKVTYDSAGKNPRTVKMFKMGCAYSSLCKDGVSYGPGPYGYSRIVRQCCCTDRCTQGDGSGQGSYEKCPWAVPNATPVPNNGRASQKLDDSLDHWWTAWTVIPTTLSFIWGVINFLTS